MAKTTRGRKAPRGTRNTEGRKLLQKLLLEHTQEFVAASIQAKQQYVSSWARGLSRPEPAFRDALDRVFGLPKTAWYSPTELEVSLGAPMAKSA